MNEQPTKAFNLHSKGAKQPPYSPNKKGCPPPVSTGKEAATHKNAIAIAFSGNKIAGKPSPCKSK